MKERPILFFGPMVLALLAGTKTQTRRAVKPQPERNERGVLMWALGKHRHIGFEGRDVHPALPEHCPYGQPGDRLWVRETWMDLIGTGIERRTGDLSRYAYGADTPPGTYGDAARKEYGLKWRPSIHMPRAASRITLEVTDVRVERLQDISEDDAEAEGIALLNNRFTFNGGLHESRTAAESYRALWETLNGPGSWDANPWVWAVEFRKLESA